MTQTFSKRLAQGTFGTARVFNKSGELICREGVEFADPLWVKDGTNGHGLYVGDIKHHFLPAADIPRMSESGKSMSWFEKIAVLFAGILCAAFSFALAISVDGLTDDPQSADVGIVLGSQVLPTGRPSQRLQARLDKTIALYDSGMYENVIVSSGIGKEDPITAS